MPSASASPHLSASRAEREGGAAEPSPFSSLLPSPPPPLSAPLLLDPALTRPPPEPPRR